MRTRSIVTAAALTFVTVLGGAGAAIADGPDAVGTTGNSPGVLSGNNLQVPVDVGLNLCGNTVDVLGLLNPATGNKCKTNG
ncbi:chaplin [Streptomyces sp. Je 1-369]|uniref:chaplin n=1 Tax=Streptomyces sp. Je 1-369 TaxID=2966192 RepID=UPI002285CA04|nr:chaplin [Streptomyces sp. Je 1-369]WAL97557.1 chaplin [Streptomyces sp. Je 1-369]